MDQKKDVVVIYQKNDEPKLRLSDCIKFGFGFYIGFNAARTLKHLIIALNTRK